ncbi:pentapeptide repeat-containing protein [Leptolyngbyaceae cyanobacterium CCMR0082]|uniref:Pentapeptide repeat-containing protein n=1 Tax=Adonisia turfae CCMR0082 TaxID=2304604 RepID=A0A6M0SHF6_9CYAN|nr:pentapeptide repeat-containing protein [Leptothoe sp. LEGE 181152]NEZ67391.1 pentapeptide repeat-containing protein [Adonisia turfae CCMR0082]
MKRHYLATLPLMALLMGAPPSRAEAPIDSGLEARVAANVQQLLITNHCQRCYLVGADLSQTHLIGADLRGADLRGADLSWSNLEGADLTGASVTHANLTGAFLTNASLVNANLDHGNFAQAQLYYVDVTGASMENLNLAQATVVGTPISIGGGTVPAEPGNHLPIFVPDEEHPLVPPQNLWLVPHPHTPDILDVPTHIIPHA